MTFRRRSYAWLWPALGGLALAGAMAARHYRRTDIAVADLPSPATTTASLPDSRAELDAISAQAAQQLRLRLTESGWRTGAAEQVAELNREFLGMLAAEDPGQLEKMADALSKLGRHSGLMSLLEQRPEVAGLLAAAPDPVEVAARLRDDKAFANWVRRCVHPARRKPETS